MVWNHLCDAGKVGSSPEDGVSVTAASLEFPGWNPQNQRTFGQKKKVGRPQTEAVMDNFAPSKWFFGDLSDTGRIEPLAAHAGRSGRCLKRSAVKRLIQINSRPRYGGCWWNIDVAACHGSILRILLDDVVQNVIQKIVAHQMGHFLSQCIIRMGSSIFGQVHLVSWATHVGEIHGPCNFVQLRLLLKKRLG